MLTDTETFVKTSPVYELMSEVLGDGLLTSEGEAWRSQRRTLQPLFTRRRVWRTSGPRRTEHTMARIAIVGDGPVGLS